MRSRAHVGRQNSRVVDLVHLRFDAMNGRRRLLAAAHENNALNDVVVVVLSGDPEPRLIACFDGCHIFHEDRTATVGGQHRLLDVGDGLNEAYAANDGGVGPKSRVCPPTLRSLPPSAANDLLQRYPSIIELLEIDGDIVGAGLAAPAVDVDHPWYGLEAPFEYSSPRWSSGR